MNRKSAANTEIAGFHARPVRALLSMAEICHFGGPRSMAELYHSYVGVKSAFG
jgi:hypothetical protein